MAGVVVMPMGVTFTLHLDFVGRLILLNIRVCENGSPKQHNIFNSDFNSTPLNYRQLWPLTAIFRNTNAVTPRCGF